VSCHPSVCLPRCTTQTFNCLPSSCSKMKLSFSVKFLESAPLYLQFYRLFPLSVRVIVIGLRICISPLLSLGVNVSSVGGEEPSLTPLLNNVAPVQASNKMPRVSNPRRPLITVILSGKRPHVRNCQNRTEVDMNFYDHKEPGICRSQ